VNHKAIIFQFEHP